MAAVAYGLFILAGVLCPDSWPCPGEASQRDGAGTLGPIVLLSCIDPPVWAGNILSAAIVLSSCLFPNSFVCLT